MTFSVKRQREMDTVAKLSLSFSFTSGFKYTFRLALSTSA